MTEASTQPAPAWTPDVEQATVYSPEALTVYLLGPMTGHAEFNAPAFRHTAEVLRGMGHRVLSPVEFDEAEGFIHEHHAEGDRVEDEEYFGFLRRDLLRILEANVDAGVALDGWEDSRGAALEVHVLRSLGKPIYRVDQSGALAEAKAPSKYQPPSDETCLETAARLVDGDRNGSYGHPALDFGRTAACWRGLFGWDVDAPKVALAMVCVKLSRLIQSRDHKDSVIDGPGYFRAYEAVLAREGVAGFQDLGSTKPSA